MDKYKMLHTKYYAALFSINSYFETEPDIQSIIQPYAENLKLHIRSERGDKLMNQKKYSLLYPDINARYRTLSDVTMHDLGMDQLCKKLSAKEREQNYIQNVMARMYADPAVTQYRCDIFEDVLRQKKMRDDLMEILGHISFLKDYGSFNREYDESAGI